MKWEYHHKFSCHSPQPNCSCKSYAQLRGLRHKRGHSRTPLRIMCRLHTANIKRLLVRICNSYHSKICVRMAFFARNLTLKVVKRFKMDKKRWLKKAKMDKSFSKYFKFCCHSCVDFDITYFVKLITVFLVRIGLYSIRFRTVRILSHRKAKK